MTIVDKETKYMNGFDDLQHALASRRGALTVHDDDDRAAGAGCAIAFACLVAAGCAVALIALFA